MTADARFWDRIAESYAKRPVPSEEVFQRKIDVTTAHLAPDRVALDIGCGTGSLALRLAPFAGHVHGLDISSEMVRIAREKTAAAGVDNVTFHVGPVDAGFPVDDGSLDVVCAYSLLHLVPDRPALLRRVWEALRPGGVLVSSTVVLGGTWMPYGLILPVMRWFGQAPRVSVIDAATVERELTEAGFVDISTPDVGGPSNVAFRVAHRPA